MNINRYLLERPGSLPIKTTNLKNHKKFHQDCYCQFEMHGVHSYIHTENVHLHNVVKFGLCLVVRLTWFSGFSEAEVWI